MKVNKSNIEFEPTVKPFVTAMSVPAYREICRILFLNGNLLHFSREFGQIGVVSCFGPQDRLDEAVNFILSNAQSELLSTAQSAYSDLYKIFIEPVIFASIGIISVENESERQSLFIAKLIEKLGPEENIQGLLKPLMPYLGAGIKPLSELLVAVLYKFYYRKFQYLQLIVPNLNRVVESLRKFGVLTPFISISICAKCINYEFVFSKSLNINGNCPKCGCPWTVLTIDNFSPLFETLKKGNKDLPVFISSYLRSSQFFPIGVYPNADIEIPGQRIEVDVLIEETSTGVECKCYEDPLIISDNMIKSKAGDLCSQVENYLKAGIKRIFIITNLNSLNAVERLEQEIKSKLNINGVIFDEIKCLSSDIENLKKFLDEEAQKISAIRMGNITQELIARIQKQNHTDSDINKQLKKDE